MSFLTLLQDRWAAADTLLCVGLDPDPDRLPASVRNQPASIAKFCVDIVDATAEFACAFKPQIAYVAAAGAEQQLEAVCEHIRTHHPTVPIILDAKRGDIGDTARMYAREAFVRYGAHAVTVNPYMGGDTLAPYQEHEGRGIVVLCRTSNPGSGEFQSRLVDGQPLYAHVARRAAEEWSKRGEVALVVGATYPAELAEVRAIVGDMPLLVPGVGAQGGDPAEVVGNGADSRGTGLIVNSSRAILYADPGNHVGGAARVARDTRDALNAAR
ncbi:MAG: orotidine-5'-phosphate decarboxylase [Actinomycetota bacterium]